MTFCSVTIKFLRPLPGTLGTTQVRVPYHIHYSWLKINYMARNKLFLTFCEMRAMFSMSYTNTIGMKLNARLSAGPEMLPAQRSTSLSFLWYQQPGLGSASCQLGLLLGHSQPCTPACSEWLRAANWSREKGLKRHVVVAPRRRQ